MIDRYVLPETRDIFSAPATLQRWIDVELLIVDAWAKVGRIPEEAATRILNARPAVSESFVEAVFDRELVTRHDVAAFVDVLTETLGDDGRWIHFGVTSSDVVDTALGVALGQAGDLVADAASALFVALVKEARRYRHLAMIGRTHGVHAEPITLGSKLALLALQVSRAAQGVAAASNAVRVGKVSGAVGTFAQVDPRVEAHVCHALGLQPIAASQVVPRDLHAALVFALARTVTSVEAVAMQIRLGHQTEVAEIREGFAPGQKGSSSMPHKRNPVTSEQLCGLAKLARAWVAPALENITLWHERDLSHSSVERLMMPDICSIAYYAARTGTELVRSWVIDEPRIRSNLVKSRDLIRSQSLLHALVEAGHQRDDAYRWVQTAARAAQINGTTLSVEARALPHRLSSDALSAALNVDRLPAGADRAVDALDDAWAMHRALQSHHLPPREQT